MKMRTTVFAALESLEFGQAHAGALGERLVVEFEPPHGFSEDVRVGVFERNWHGVE